MFAPRGSVSSKSFSDNSPGPTLTRRAFAEYTGALLSAVATLPITRTHTAWATDSDGANATGTYAAARPSSNGRLHVKAGKLVDAQDTPIQLRGFSTHGLAWFPQYVNAKCFAQLADWGANLARLALYPHESGGYCVDGNQHDLRGLLDNGVAYAAQADMYAVIDWHVLQECDPNVYLEQALEFWDDISRSYAACDNIIYEICNEPNGDTTWDAVKAYGEAVLAVIRANDPSAVVLVGTPTWSQRPDLAAANPLADDNVMYTLHFYAATHKDDLRATLRAVSEAGMPVFVSEYGICDAGGSGSLDIESADTWIALMDELGISSACWNLSNKAESSSFIAPTCDKVSGFEKSDFTECGLWFKQMLADSSTADSPANSGDEAGKEMVSEMSGGGQRSPTVESHAQTANVASTQDTVACTVAMRQTWESNGETSLLYDVSIANQTDCDIDSWFVELVFSESFDLADGWNAMFEVDGCTLRISPVSYNAALKAGSSWADIGFIVQGTSQLALVEIHS